MKTHNREIMLYYNPESSSDRKTLAHAKSVVPHLRTFAHGKTPSSSTSWQQIIRSLKVHPKELMDKSHPYYQSNIRGREFNSEGWVNVLRKNPELIKAPIAIRGKRAILCNTPTDILKLVEENGTPPA